MSEDQTQADGWETQADIDACLATTGLTMDQMRRWRRGGLLPFNVAQTSPLPYHGSEIRYPAGTCEQIAVAAELYREKSLTHYVGWRLWLKGYPVNERFWRPRLRKAADSIDLPLRLLGGLARRLNRDELGPTLADKLAEVSWNASTLSRLDRRLEHDEKQVFAGVLESIVSGDFEQFEPPVGDETYSKGKTVALKALDLQLPKKEDKVLGIGSGYAEALPSTLTFLAATVASGSFVREVEGPTDVIFGGRDALVGSFSIATSMYVALNWIYGEKAFGLRLANWVAIRSSDEIIAIAILVMSRLRQLPGAIHSSEQIAKMARDAEELKIHSLQLKSLWRHDPRFKDVLSPKRIRGALRDKITLEKWRNDVRRASMRQR